MNLHRHESTHTQTQRFAGWSFLAIALIGVLLTGLFAACGPASVSEDAQASVTSSPTRSSATATPQSTQEPIGSPTNQATASPTPDETTAIDAFLAQFGDWQPAVVQTTDHRTLESGSVAVDGRTYQCAIDTRSLGATRVDILAAGINTGQLWPGALVQGQSVATGNLSVLPLARAPMTLSIDLAVPDPIVTVADPYSASAQAAVSSLQRAADQRLGGIDVVPAAMSYVRDESYSFDQAILSIGVSASYSTPFAGAGLDASFSSERKVGSHTIIVKFYQPMYTIQFADDRVSSPADLFASSVTEGDLQEQAELKRISPDNPPVLIKSVTYGRMMVFTMTSTQVESADRLMAAVNAVYGNFSGSASISKSDLDIIRNSRIDMKVFGGQQDAALEAIQSGDLSRFFSRAEAANAVPLSFRTQQLDGEPVELRDATTFQAQTCAKQVYHYRVRLWNIDDDAYVYVNGALIKHQVGDSLTLPVNAYLGDGNNTLEIVLGNGGCFASSLNMAIDVNGVQKVTRGYSTSFAFCGYQFDWKYTINQNTGVVQQVA